MQNPSIPNVLPVNAGVYTVTLTNSSCTVTATASVVVNPGVDPCVKILDYYFVRTNYPSTYQMLFPLTNGQNIAKNEFQNSIIVKPICPTISVGSVELKITGGPYNLNWTILQSFPHFALFDNSGDILNGQRFPAGTFNLKVTGYAEKFGLGGITYGPVNTVFNIVDVPNTISAPTITGTEFCAGTNLNVSFTTTGTYDVGNTFQVQLSNPMGNFDISSPIIGSSDTQGTIICTLPTNLLAGNNYKVKVFSTAVATVGNNNATGININPINLPLISPIDDLNAGTITKKAVKELSASNKISGTARVDYKGGNAVNLNPGFQVVSNPGSSFKVNIEGCL